MTLQHRHHIVPRHDGGTDEPENLTPPISVQMHAEFHRDRWEALGQVGDFIAWQTLTGQIKISDGAVMASRTANSGRKLSAAWRAKISASGKGRLVSEETRAKLSSANKGKTLSAEHRAKVGLASRGRRPSEETRRKIGAAWKGKKRGLRSEEHRRKLSAALTGKKHNFSFEHRANIKVAITAWWRQKKLTKISEVT